MLAASVAVGVLTACTGKAAVVSGPQSDSQGYVSGNGTVQVYAPDRRVPAPNIEGESLAGGVTNIRDFDGDVVVLNFWASWCSPCRTEQPNLNTVYAATQAKGVKFLGINIDDDDAAARAYIRTKDVAYSSIVDQPGSIALEFSPRLPATPPTTVIIDREGRVAAKILGPAEAGVLQPLVEQFAAETTS
jgi:thiol-disulfide isomerase/thioredoxin